MSVYLAITKWFPNSSLSPFSHWWVAGEAGNKNVCQWWIKFVATVRGFPSNWMLYLLINYTYLNVKRKGGRDDYDSWPNISNHPWRVDVHNVCLKRDWAKCKCACVTLAQPISKLGNVTLRDKGRMWTGQSYNICFV